MTGADRSSVLRSTALLVMAAAIPLLLFAALSGALSLLRERDESHWRAVGEAHRLADAIDRELETNMRLVEALADHPALDGPRLDVPAFMEAARRHQARNPLWLTVILSDASGRRLADSASPTRLGMALDPASVTEALRVRRPVIGSLAKGPQRFGLPIRAPVIRRGEADYVVTAVMAPDQIRRDLLASGLRDSWIAAIIDSRGVVVARSRSEDRFLGKRASERALQARRAASSGIYEGQTLEGVRTESAFWRSPETGWSVHIGVPAEEFRAPLRRSLMISAAGMLLSLVLGGLFVLLLMREGEQRRRKLAAADQTQRLEALGRLTGGVAHDFNNLLMIIQGNAELLGRRMKERGTDTPLQAIRQATERASRLTRELLVFARGGAAAPVAIDLNLTIANFLGALREAAGPDVVIEPVLDAPGIWIEADRVQLEMALLNLVVNARDAMAGAGVVTIGVRLADGRVELTVRDTGPGFERAAAAQAFDAFFTTKAATGGTGLGLTQVRSFAERSGGQARLQSAKGRGAEVVLSFPSIPAPPEGAPPDQIGNVELALNGRRILLVDDNAEVRQVAARYLRELGVQVEEAAGGEEAVPRLRSEGYDALVSDIVMPGPVDGIVLAREAAVRRPGMPVLLVSGYSASVEVARAQGLTVLAKPYELSELARALADALAGAAEPGPSPSDAP